MPVDLNALNALLAEHPRDPSRTQADGGARTMGRRRDPDTIAKKPS